MKDRLIFFGVLALVGVAIAVWGVFQFRSDTAANDNSAGITYLGRGEYEQAAAAFTASIEKKPTTVSYTNRGQAYLELGKLNQAEADFTSALQLDARNYRALLHRGKVRSRQGNLPGALADFQQAAAIMPDSVEIQVQLGTALRDTGDLVGAKAAFDAGLKLAKNDPDWTRLINNLLGAMGH